MCTVTRDCNCGSLVAAGNSDRSGALSPARLAALRRKGWTDARIERWKRERAQAAVRPAGKRDEDRAYWEALFSYLQDRFRVKRVGLLAHAFDGKLDEEPVVPLRTAEFRHDPSTLLERLGAAEMDVLYRVALTT